MIRNIIPDAWKPFLRRLLAVSEELQWRVSGKPIPPPRIVKQKTVRSYARLFGIQTLIETGTFLGEMIDATKREFSAIYSVELDPHFYAEAKRKYGEEPRIRIFQGDSARVLPDILKEIKERSLFWLDAHYSGKGTARAEKLTPIEEELKAILSHEIKDHVILIDDAREFSGHDDYPSIETLRQLFLDLRPEWVFDVAHDIIRAHPASKK